MNQRRALRKLVAGEPVNCAVNDIKQVGSCGLGLALV